MDDGVNFLEHAGILYSNILFSICFYLYSVILLSICFLSYKSVFHYFVILFNIVQLGISTQRSVQFDRSGLPNSSRKRSNLPESSQLCGRVKIDIIADRIVELFASKSDGMSAFDLITLTICSGKLRKGPSEGNNRADITCVGVHHV